MRKSRLISFLLMIAILIMFSGCATTTVKPENVRTGEKDFFDKVERAYDLEDYNKVIELTRSCADSNPTCARWLAQAHFYSDQYQESIKYYAKYLILKRRMISQDMPMGQEYIWPLLFLIPASMMRR